MLEDKQRWNQRFSNKPLSFPKPPAFILEQAPVLASGRVLDIASGDGAASLLLAEKGAEVVAVDISDVALQRLESFAVDKQLDLSTACIDLDDHVALKVLGEFDAIVMAHFKPSVKLLRVLIELLSINGVLVVTTFNLKHHEKNDFSKRFCLLPEEFLRIDERLSCEVYKSVEREGDYMDDYLFKRL